MNDPSPSWKRGALVGLGVLAIIFSILAFVHPGMTVITLVYIMGIALIIVGLEKIVSGIFEGHRSKWSIGPHLRFFSYGLSDKYRSLCDNALVCYLLASLILYTVII